MATATQRVAVIRYGRFNSTHRSFREDGTDDLYWNVGKKLPLLVAYSTEERGSRGQYLSHSGLTAVDVSAKYPLRCLLHAAQ
jgi:hypothetical protein